MVGALRMSASAIATFPDWSTSLRKDGFKEESKMAGRMEGKVARRGRAVAWLGRRLVRYRAGNWSRRRLGRAVVALLSIRSG